ncbi:MAG: PP2C family protein-serine/threonine phosphatase [Hyphomicrobium sp.]
MAAFEHASCATQGARSYQEDSALVWAIEPAHAFAAVKGDGGGIDRGPDRGVNRALVAVLADGMGGHAGGAIASRTACDSFIRGYVECETADGNVLMHGTHEVADPQHAPSTRSRLVAGLEAANDAIARTVQASPALNGMGSTLIGVVFGEHGVEWVSVGDSPLLFYRQGEIATLNEDHSMAPELDRLAAIGEMSIEAARRDPRRHMLRSAVTGDDLDLVDLSRRPLKTEPGDYVILASDGLQTLEMDEIERIVAAYADDGAAAVAEALIRAVVAIRDPHQDNTTVVAVRAI